MAATVDLSPFEPVSLFDPSTVSPSRPGSLRAPRAAAVKTGPPKERANRRRRLGLEGGEHGARLALPEPAVISGLASLVGFPAAIAVAELALRYARSMVIATCVISVLVCVALAVTAGGCVRIVRPLLVLVLLQVSSIGDVGALTIGAVEAADAARRGAALALYVFTGYVTAFAGPVIASVALDWFGGAGRPEAWSAAFAAIALGSAAAACAVGAAATLPGPIC
ncbi:MAG: hypothetical protein JOZ35_13985 [Hyphomicrobiales bacterium]|nr:hypothetical protein [Hyphomicrobiales bacterium]